MMYFPCAWYYNRINTNNDSKSNHSNNHKEAVPSSDNIEANEKAAAVNDDVIHNSNECVHTCENVITAYENENQQQQKSNGTVKESNEYSTQIAINNEENETQFVMELLDTVLENEEKLPPSINLAVDENENEGEVLCENV